MKIEYQNVNTNKLHDELITNGITPLLVESKEGITWISFVEGTNMDLVQQIIDSHDPTPLPPKPTQEELLRADIDYLSIMTGVDLYV
jgi:hypothetical protein